VKADALRAEATDLARHLAEALGNFPVATPSPTRIAWVKAHRLKFKGRLYAGLLRPRPSKHLSDVTIQGLLGVGPWHLLFLGAQLHARQGGGDPFCVSLILNADARLLSDFRDHPTASVYVGEIEAMLAHELVHVRDRKRGVVITDVDPRSDPHGYYGNRAELRAYAEQVVVEAVLLVQGGADREDLELLLRRSPTYRQLGGRVPEKVRREIRKAVRQALRRR